MNINITEGDIDKPTYDPPILVKLIHARKNDVFYRTATTQGGRFNSKFSITSNGVLVQQTIFDSSVQIVVSSVLFQRILMVSHHPLVAGHPCQLRMNDTLRRHLCWLHIANEVNPIVSTCQAAKETTPSTAVSVNCSSSQHLDHLTFSQLISWDRFSKQRIVARTYLSL